MNNVCGIIFGEGTLCLFSAKCTRDFIFGASSHLVRATYSVWGGWAVSHLSSAFSNASAARQPDDISALSRLWLFTWPGRVELSFNFLVCSNKIWTAASRRYSRYQAGNMLSKICFILLVISLVHVRLSAPQHHKKFYIYTKAHTGLPAATHPPTPRTRSQERVVV